MKDIDFDELDRAVNSLMSGVPKAEPAKEDDVKTLALSVAAPAHDDEPEQASPAASAVQVRETPPAEEQPKPAPSPAPSITAPPAVRRGRFMDMVRPGAPEANNPVPSRPVSRHSAIIEPSAGFAPSTAPSADGVVSPPREAPVQPDTSSSTDWPDPLASVDFNKTTEAMKDKTPLTTPFLPDAKVEKRPLGRSSDSDDVPEPDHAPVLGALATSENGMGESADTRGDTPVPQQPLPAEFSQDVMAIEADTSSLTPEETEPAEEVKASPIRPAAPTPAARPVATSIPQQYKVHPKVADPSPGAIYDTAAYHQPLTHPVKKKPGWLWVIAIILILILGAASGAAVYYYGLV
jgi:hypothetical protein